MNPERRRQIDAVLQSALERDASERRAFLDEICASDEALRVEVESRLSVREQAEDFLEKSALECMVKLIANDPSNAATALYNDEDPLSNPADRFLPDFLSGFLPGLLPGFLLDERYLIERELDSGGGGAVFLARDQKLVGAKTVIKVLHECLAKGEHRRWFEKKFQDEIKALALIDHPGVVRPLDCGKLSDGRPYLVMQYVPGESLREEITPHGMDLERVGDLIHQIAQALTAAHEQGIIHRDLKPENIMLQSAGEREYVKLIDFGIATVHETVRQATAEQTVSIGTLPYMAPEQLDGRPTVASDIYALGVIAYEMVTGRRPFNPKKPFDLPKLQRAGVRIKPCDLRPELPHAAQAAILRALSFEQQNRYAKATDFSEALSQALKPAAAALPSSPELAHVLFSDLVGYSKMTLNEQERLTRRLQEIVSGTREFKRAEASDQLIPLPTGDGMALVFFDNPVSPALCAVEIARALKGRPEFKLRMGIHTGLVQRTIDINGNPNASGDGINIAQRVMDCGYAGHILLSKTVADALSQLDEWRPHLHDCGERKVKHGLRLRIFNLYTDEVGRRFPQPLPLALKLSLAALLVTISVIVVWPLLNRSSPPGENGITDPSPTPPIIGSRLPDDSIGVTVLRLRPSPATQNVQSMASPDHFERVSIETTFKAGERVTLGIETPCVTGCYLYVIDREQYANGRRSKPYLIFPGPTTPSEGNRTTTGMVTSIPTQGDPYTAFTLQRSRHDQISELLTIIVTKKALEHNAREVLMGSGVKMFELDEATVSEWEKKWGGPVELIEAKNRGDRAQTKMELEAIRGERILLPSNPLPQTIYRVKAKRGDTLLIRAPLRIERN